MVSWYVDIWERNRTKYLVEYGVREKNQGRLAPKYIYYEIGENKKPTVAEKLWYTNSVLL